MEKEWTAHARGTCDACGTYRLPATCITVRQRLDDGTWSYRLRCPGCQHTLVAAVRPRVALQLLLARAPFETWSFPDSARETGTGDPVTLGDLGDLRADLDRVDIVDALRASLASHS